MRHIFFALIMLFVLPYTFSFASTYQQPADSCTTNGLSGEIAVSNNNLVLIGWTTGEAKLWDIETGTILQTFPHADHPVEITGTAISADDQWVATADPQRVKVWDVTNGVMLWEFHHAHEDMHTPLAFSPDNELLFVGGANGASIWNLVTGERKLTFPASMEGRLGSPPQISSDFRYVVTTNFSLAEASVWDATTGAVIHSFENVPRSKKQIAFASASEVIVNDGTRLSFWNIEDNRVIHTFAVETGTIEGWRLSPDGRYLMIQKNVGETYDIFVTDLWDVAAERQLLASETLFGLTNAIFLPDSATLLVTSSRDDHAYEALVWNIENRSSQYSFDLREASPRKSIATHDGRYWICVTEERSINVYDLNTGVLEYSIC